MAEWLMTGIMLSFVLDAAQALATIWMLQTAIYVLTAYRSRLAFFAVHALCSIGSWPWLTMGKAMQFSMGPR